MSQTGRIGGQVLTDNLLRAGVDLAFETDLLYLDVTNKKIGIKKSPPVYDLDVDSYIRTNNLIVTGQATIDDIVFTAPNTISSIIAPIDIFINGSTLFHDRLTTSLLEFDDNFISSFSNSNIVLDPNGTGTVEIYSTTNITGVLDVSGNIVAFENLKIDGTSVLGNGLPDSVTVNASIISNVLPTNNNFQDLGTELLRWKTSHNNNVDILGGFTVGNITVATPSSISVPLGNISINVAGADPSAFFTGDVRTSGLMIEGNLIQSFTNQPIIFNPSGTGIINLEATTNVTGNLGVSGNTVMSGNLQTASTIIIGDQIIDTVTINTDFTQSIILGADNLYDLGKSNKRWAQVHASDWTNITTGAWPGSGLYSLAATVSDQMTLDGVINKISTIQSNEDILLNPDSGITRIENIQWQNNFVTNLLDSNIRLSGIGRGYVKIDGTNGFVMPAGTTDQRDESPAVGTTRWNTDLQYIECFDGNIWIVSTGPEQQVTLSDMEDISNIWGLILG